MARTPPKSEYVHDKISSSGLDKGTIIYSLADVVKRKEKLLDLYLADSFSKEQLDERLAPLNTEEIELKATIKALSKSNDEIHHDIAEVDETLNYLKEQDKMLNERVNRGNAFNPLTKEQMLAGLERIVVEPDGHLTVELKAYEEIDRLLAKHRRLMDEQRIKQKVS